MKVSRAVMLGIVVFMTVEFRTTSDFRELEEIAEARNASPEWRGVLEIKPSINRIVRIRGRLPAKQDITDILYDLDKFAQIHITTGDLFQRLSLLAELESTYYPLTENFAYRVARDTGDFSRVPDFIDEGKDLAAHSVWYLWRPERGEDFQSLNRLVKARLNRALKSSWYGSHFYQTFSCLETQELHQAENVDEEMAQLYRAKPRTRLKQATQHLSLPSMVATVDECDPIEKIASLAVMGYYPDGRGLTGVAKQIHVDRVKLGYALNRAIEKLVQATDGAIPERSIREIVDEIVKDGKYSYASGSAVVRNSPRYTLLTTRTPPVGLTDMEERVVELARMRKGNTLIYSNNEQIARQLGIGKNIVYKTIRNVASRLQQNAF